MRFELLVFAMVFVMVAALSGCQTTELPDTPPTTEPPKTEPTENGVTRVLSATEVNAGDTIDIELYINLEPGQSYYLVDEAVPKELEVTNKEPNKDNHLKLVQIQNAKSSVYKYTVKASAPGTYTFSGEYALEGMDAPADIMGAIAITVK